MTNRPKEVLGSMNNAELSDHELPEAKIIDAPKRIIESGPVISLSAPAEASVLVDPNLELAPIEKPEEPILEPDHSIALEEKNTAEIEEKQVQLIHFNDLPIVWQKHVLKRKEGGFLPLERDVFSKQEILDATVDPTSWTDPKVVDKVFIRAKKSKIPFDILPAKWQEILTKNYQKEIETFGDVTVEALEKNEASPEDIKTLQRKALELSRISNLKQQLTVPENPKPILLARNPSFVDKVLAQKSQAKKSFWSKAKSWLGF